MMTDKELKKYAEDLIGMNEAGVEYLKQLPINSLVGMAIEGLALSQLVTEMKQDIHEDVENLYKALTRDIDKKDIN
jgi:hypothetical protein